MVNGGEVNQTRLLPSQVQQLVNWFAFFLAFPAINFLDNSITFYLFIAILFKIGPFWQFSFPGKYLLNTFLVIVIVSSLFAPYNKMPRHPGLEYSITILFQYFYWVLVASFFSLYYKKINKYLVGKYILAGLIFSIIGFYLLPFKIDLDILDISFVTTRNNFVFIMLSCIPISLYYLNANSGKKRLPLFFILFFLTIMFTNGRSGAIIIIVELLIITVSIYPIWSKFFKVSWIPLLFIFLFIQSEVFQPMIENLASSLENINPRFSQLLLGEDEGDLTYDKSWLLRKLMIDKSVEIIPDYPIFGIGPNNFTYYDAALNDLSNYERLAGQSHDFYNSRSAHNSYIQIATEFGVPAFVLFLSLLFVPILKIFYYIKLNNPNLSVFAIVALVGISIHFYTISSITGAIPWFVIGLSWGESHIYLNKLN